MSAAPLLTLIAIAAVWPFGRDRTVTATSPRILRERSRIWSTET